MWCLSSDAPAPDSWLSCLLSSGLFSVELLLNEKQPQFKADMDKGGHSLYLYMLQGIVCEPRPGSSPEGGVRGWWAEGLGWC